jgi:secondary thiamine-phosphate synthase enzyme
MQHATDYLTFETPNRRDYVNITDQVESFVRGSGIHHGLCLVNPMHITAAVYVNDAESGLIQDIDDWLERLAPHEPTEQYRHNNGEDNADAHLKRHLMSHQVVLPITRPRPLGAGLLRRVRRPAAQARRPEGDRRMSAGEDLNAIRLRG